MRAIGRLAGPMLPVAAVPQIPPVIGYATANCHSGGFSVEGIWKRLPDRLPADGRWMGLADINASPTKERDRLADGWVNCGYWRCGSIRLRRRRPGIGPPSARGGAIPPREDGPARSARTSCDPIDLACRKTFFAPRGGRGWGEGSESK